MDLFLFPTQEWGWVGAAEAGSLWIQILFTKYSHMISLLDQWPLQVEDGGILRQQIMRQAEETTNGSGPCRPDITGGLVEGLSSGRETTQKICCPFPLEWRFPRKALLFRPRPEIRESPPFVAWLWRGQESSGSGRKEVGGGGAVSRWKL